VSRLQVNTFWRTSVQTTSIQSGTIAMLTGLEHIIWMTQRTGARWAQWYQYLLAQVATSLSGIMNMCIPKNTLPHCYTQMSGNHANVCQVLASVCAINWSYNFAKPKRLCSKTNIPKGFQEHEQTQGFNSNPFLRWHYCSIRCWQNRNFLCYQLRLSPACSNSC